MKLANNCKYMRLTLQNILIIIWASIYFGSPARTMAAESASVPVGINPAQVETIRTGYGVKSVLMSPDWTKVYSINLEAMSVYEIDRASRKVLRKLAFIPTVGTGFDYQKNTRVDSFEEKPVEGHFTHNGRYLWLSLHNSNGVVVWDLQSGDTFRESQPYKEAWITNMASAAKGNTGKIKVRLLWFQTGKTPKVITSSPDGRYLFVANWHSGNVSVLAIEEDDPAQWHKVTDLSTGRIPRGLAVSADSSYLYVAQMGGSAISVVDLATLVKVDEIWVGRNPRHIVMADDYLYVSLNSVSKIVKVDLATRKVVASVATGKSPRTIALSGDGRTLFVACYHSDELQAFTTKSLEPLGSWQSRLHPVGLDLFDDGEKREVWVSNYISGTINVYTFSGAKLFAGTREKQIVRNSL